MRRLSKEERLILAEARRIERGLATEGGRGVLPRKGMEVLMRNWWRHFSREEGQIIKNLSRVFEYLPSPEHVEIALRAVTRILDSPAANTEEKVKELEWIKEALEKDLYHRRKPFTHYF